MGRSRRRARLQKSPRFDKDGRHECDVEAPMRSVLFAALFCLLGSTAFAQDARQQMDRAEEALSARLAPAGVAVERTAPDEIRLTMPSDITFDFDRANVRREFMP